MYNGNLTAELASILKEAITDMKALAKSSPCYCCAKRDTECFGCSKSFAWASLHKAEKLLEAVETTDTVSVVRCRDCIYYKAGLCNRRSILNPAESAPAQRMNESDYCSYGIALNIKEESDG